MHIQHMKMYTEAIPDVDKIMDRMHADIANGYGSVAFCTMLTVPGKIICCVIFKYTEGDIPIAFAK